MRGPWLSGGSRTLRTGRARQPADRAPPSMATRGRTSLQTSSPPASAVPAFCLTPLILVSSSGLVHMASIGDGTLAPSTCVNERLFYFCKLSVNLNVKVRQADAQRSFYWSCTGDGELSSNVTDNLQSLVTDNDSDDTVNGGSPKPPPIRQHRKEKKEFPVSQKIVHNMFWSEYASEIATVAPHLCFQWVLGWECQLWSKSLYFTFGAPPNSRLALPSNLKYVVFPSSDPNAHI